MAYPLKTGNAKLCGDTLHQSQADNVFLVRNIVSRKSRFEKKSFREKVASFSSTPPNQRRYLECRLARCENR
ncbi:hypothetical protein FLM05_16380 [Vibrio cholerae]|nr:hypothetical protein [Vibrio cholerae]EGR0727658.1 hypothetical protein [Vibrio cholerae]EGR0784246.1 hypothetical protein [Vibrio cholerae]EGR0833970.1 hypothetical protein [Vibrio cholerae]EGR0842698.1 hypothetical protein [Vibrio cholerae]